MININCNPLIGVHINHRNNNIHQLMWHSLHVTNFCIFRTESRPHYTFPHKEGRKSPQLLATFPSFEPLFWLLQAEFAFRFSCTNTGCGRPARRCQRRLKSLMKSASHNFPANLVFWGFQRRSCLSPPIGNHPIFILYGYISVSLFSSGKLHHWKRALWWTQLRN